MCVAVLPQQRARKNRNGEWPSGASRLRQTLDRDLLKSQSNVRPDRFQENTKDNRRLGEGGGGGSVP